jgi:hypothetical protein
MTHNRRVFADPKNPSQKDKNTQNPNKNVFSTAEQ